MYSRLAVVLAGAILYASPMRPTPTLRDSERIQSLAWLAGCWEASSGTRSVEEQWLRPRGGTMMGMSRTVRREGKLETTQEYEFLRLFARDGKLVYAALPSGQQGTEFVETELGESQVTFGNPAHDFPQIIRYRRVGADSLQARVEGTLGGNSRGFDVRYRRVPCAVTPSS